MVLHISRVCHCSHLKMVRSTNISTDLTKAYGKTSEDENMVVFRHCNDVALKLSVMKKNNKTGFPVMVLLAVPRRLFCFGSLVVLYEQIRLKSLLLSGQQCEI